MINPLPRPQPTTGLQCRKPGPADSYGAMREARPYRPALHAPAAKRELALEAEEGRLDPEAVDAVLVGHSPDARATSSA